MTRDGAPCPACNAFSSGARYCRQCGTALDPDARVSPDHPIRGPATTAGPQPAAVQQQAIRAAVPPVTGQTYSAGVGQSNGWGYAAVPAQVPPPPAFHWIPMPGQSPSPRRHSTAFAVGGMIAIVLVLLAIAATVILLVAEGGSNHTGILTQSSATGSKSEQPVSP